MLQTNDEEKINLTFYSHYNFSVSLSVPFKRAFYDVAKSGASGTSHFIQLCVVAASLLFISASEWRRFDLTSTSSPLECISKGKLFF